MVQVDISNNLMKEVIRTADNDPIYRSLDLDSKKSYVKEILKDYVKLKGDFMRQAFREEVEKILIQHQVTGNK